MPKPYNLALVAAWIVFMVVTISVLMGGLGGRHAPAEAGWNTSEHGGKVSCKE